MWIKISSDDSIIILVRGITMVGTKGDLQGSNLSSRIFANDLDVAILCRLHHNIKYADQLFKL